MKSPPALIICMGVSGCGKSSVAARLADRLPLKFIEADDFHSRENKTRMAAGRALTDEMREIWVERLCLALGKAAQQGQDCVLAYSGLKQNHRQRFRKLGFRTLYLHLQGDRALIEERIKKRARHFVSGALLESQFADMQPPSDDEVDVITISVAHGLADVINTSLRAARTFIQIV